MSDRELLIQMYDLRPRLIHRYIKRGMTIDNAEDLASEVILEAFEGLHRYDRSRPLWPWLSAVGHNLYVDSIKKRNRDLPWQDIDVDDALFQTLDMKNSPNENHPLVDWTDPDIIKEGVELVSTLFKGILDMSEETQKVIIMVAHGVSHPDIGEALGITSLAVRLRLMRARRKIKKMLTDEAE